MIPKEKTTKEIVKVADNNVEVKYFIELKSGEKIYLDEYTESYGQNRLDKEKAQAQAELDKWTAKETVDNLKAKAQEKLTNLQEIETKLKK